MTSSPTSTVAKSTRTSPDIRRCTSPPTAAAVPVKPTSAMKISPTTTNGSSSNSGMPMIEIDRTMTVSTMTGSARSSARRPTAVTFNGASITRSADASTPRRATISAMPVTSSSSDSRRAVPKSRGIAPNDENHGMSPQECHGPMCTPNGSSSIATSVTPRRTSAPPSR